MMSGANVNQEALEKLAQSCSDMQDQCYESVKSFLQEVGDKYKSVARRGNEIGSKLLKARDDLRFAKICEMSAKTALIAANLCPPPWRIPAVAAASAALAFAVNHRQNCEKKVSLLEEALKSYQEIAKRLKEIYDETHFELKSLLSRYAELNLDLCRRLNLASRDLEEYFFPAPDVEFMDFDFQKEHFPQSTHLEDQYKKVLEKEDFCVDEKAKEKYGIEYTQYNLPILPFIFEITVSDDNLRKDENFHYSEGIKQLQKELALNEKLHDYFSYDQIEQINQGITPRGHVWYHDPNPPIGRLQLINEELLLAVKTPKGYDLWQKALKKN